MEVPPQDHANDEPRYALEQRMGRAQHRRTVDELRKERLRTYLFCTISPKHIYTILEVNLHTRHEACTITVVVGVVVDAAVEQVVTIGIYLHLA